MSSSGDQPERPDDAQTVEQAPARRRQLAVLAAVCLIVPAIALGVALAAGDSSQGGGGLADPGDGSMPEAGEAAPLFDLPGLDGTRVRLADFLGKPVVLTFFASWCHPCSEEIPHLNDALVEHADEGLVVLGIAFRDLEADSVRFLDELGATWPAARDPDNAAADAYGVRNIPVTFFIDRRGRVVDRGFGLTTPDSVAEPLERLLSTT